MKKLYTALILITLIFLAITAQAATIRVSWDPNTEDDLAGYKVYYGTASGQYGAPVDVGLVTTFDVLGIDDETEYFVAVTAYDLSGNESDFSDEVSIIIGDLTPPGPPKNIILQILDQVAAFFKRLFSGAGIRLIS